MLTFNSVPNPGRAGRQRSEQYRQRKSDRDLQELCKGHTEEAVKTLVVAMRFKGPQQVPAAIAILDRGWGKPKQTIEADGSISSIHLHLIAALETKSQSEQPPTIQQTEPQPANLLDAPPPTE